MGFLQPLMLIALPLVALPIIIHLINQWRYQTRPWGAMMFLLAANRMNRGFAKLRQWLILAMRTLVVAGLLFAVARPLASGLLGFSGGGNIDTTIVLLDRSPSMQQQGTGGATKLDTGRQQLAAALKTLGATHWVAIDGNGQAHEFDALDAMLDSPQFLGNSATADLPGMFAGTLEYLKANKPGPTEIWVCSDLRKNDWAPESGSWSLSRNAIAGLPQTVGVNLVAFPEPTSANLAVRVTKAVVASGQSATGQTTEDLLLSMKVTRTTRPGAKAASGSEPIAIEIEVNGARSTINAEMTGNQLDLRAHRVPLGGSGHRGWGRVAIPADANSADNEFFFVFDDPPLRRVVVVSDDRNSTRAVEIAASISEDGTENPAVDVLAPGQLDSLVLEDTSLLVWQTDLPDAQTAPAVSHYIDQGGQVIFFPPVNLGVNTTANRSFHSVSWSGWKSGDSASVMVENWRGDQDLLAATASGTGLPLGNLSLEGYATLKHTSEISQLASLSGGDSLLARVPTDRGGIYFCTTRASADSSSLAESGIVLFVAIQRAMDRGQAALNKSTARTATIASQGLGAASAEPWQLIAGRSETLSTDYAAVAGVYQRGDLQFAVNRDVSEDRTDTLQDEQLADLFNGLQYSRIDGQAGDMDGIVREIWRVFLIIMIAALLIEAWLCIPRRRAAGQASTSPSAG